MADSKGGLKTLFKEAVMDSPDLGGTWGGSKNGDTSFQGAEKGDAGKIPEVTYVDVAGGKSQGAKIGMDESAGGAIAGKSTRKSADLKG